jgi:hypothetical protein
MRAGRPLPTVDVFALELDYRRFARKDQLIQPFRTSWV